MTSFFTSISEAVFPSDWPPYDPRRESPYDLTQYGGRIAHFYTILDARTLLTTETQLQQSIALLESYRQSLKTESRRHRHEHDAPVNNRDLWNSKLMTASMLHPDTQQTIPWPFRFSAFPVINIPICVVLLYPGSTAIQIFGQFINQSYNVAVNFANRNATNPMSNSKLMGSYLAAVSCSCGIAFALKKVTSNLNPHSAFLRGFIPYTALTLASCLNVYFIRWNEITEGITLKIKVPAAMLTFADGNDTRSDSNSGGTDNGNGNGTDDGSTSAWEWKELETKSKRAGHLALMKCSVARLVWSAPPMFFPPMIMAGLFLNRRWFQNLKRYQKMIVEASVIGGVLLVFIPPCLAIYPQEDHCSNKWLEPAFKEQYSDDTAFYFNKGL